MFPRGPRVAFPQSVVELLVVRVLESLLLHGPFEVPIDFGHETESRYAFANVSGHVGPEEGSATSPRSLEHVRQDQHRHVAPDTVALPGYPQELGTHRL